MDSFTPEQVEARLAVWSAMQDGTGLTLSAEQVEALHRSIMDTGLELCKLRTEVHEYRFNDPTIRTMAVKTALELVMRTGKGAMRDADGTPSTIANSVAYAHKREVEDVQAEIDHYAEKCLG